MSRRRICSTYGFFYRSHHVVTKTTFMRSIRTYSTTKQEWRTLFQETAKANKISQLTDWYQVHYHNLDTKTAEIVRTEFKDNMYLALSSIFPEVEWHPWKFKQQTLPHKFWKDQSNQRKFFDDLGKKLGVHTLDDWYEKLSSNVWWDSGGGSLLKMFNNSPADALLSAYPEHNWTPWKFDCIRPTYWKSIENQRKYFDWLGQKLGVKELDDWFQHLSENNVTENRGGILLSMYHYSTIGALMAAYPEHKWSIQNFSRVPLEFWNNTENQRKYFDLLGKHLGVQQLDDWYHKLTYDSLQRNGGQGLLQQCTNLPQVALMTAYPEHPWVSRQFKKVSREHYESLDLSVIEKQRIPQGYWRVQSNVKQFFDDLGKKIGVESLDDWYQKLSVKLLEENGGAALLVAYGSVIKALMTAYPEHQWVVKDFRKVPQGYWSVQSNVKRFFDDLGKQIGIQTLDDWYEKLSVMLLEENGGSMLVSVNGSPIKALMAAYPEHDWKLAQFRRVPHGYWNVQSNVQKYFDELGKKIGIQTLDDWYQELSGPLLEENGGGSLPILYGSAIKALMTAYPEHQWTMSRFKKVPQGYWSIQSNVRSFFDDLGKQIGIQTLDDWYDKLSRTVVEENGGGSLGAIYGSLNKALMAAYPEHDWLIWKFSTVPGEFWNSFENQRTFLDWLEEQLAIENLDDWYRVDVETLGNFGAMSLIQKYDNGLCGFLQQHYPHHPWDNFKFRQPKKAQRWLVVVLKKMFPNEGAINLFTA